MVASQLLSQAQQAVQVLFEAFEQADNQDEFLDEVPTGAYYEGICTVIIRTLFVLYAQDRKQLPVTNGYYKNHFGLQFP